jgi:hypothetical protein
MTLKNLPVDLIEAFSKNLGVFFVGAGLSIPAGFPTWDGLITELIQKGKSSGRISDDKVKEYQSLMTDTNKFLILAEELRVELGAVFTRYMEDRFQSADSQPTKNHEYIVRTNSSLTITINYDDLIEKAYNNVYGIHPNIFIYSQSKEAANNFWKNRFFILKAHGDARRDVDTLILSQKDYRRTLYREVGYRSLLQSIFTTKSILFVGVSLNDPEFNQLLDYLHDSYHGGGPIHYLLVEKPRNSSTLTRRYFDDFNIQTVEFDNDSGDFGQLTEILKMISEACPRV